MACMRLSWLMLAGLLAGCAGKSVSQSPQEPTPVFELPPLPGPPEARPSAVTLAEAKAALAAGDPARAVAVYARLLAEVPQSGADQTLREAYPGFARALEQIGDYPAAARMYTAYLQRFPNADNRAEILARRGACQAEVGEWSASAASFAEARKAGQMLASVQVEMLAREGYALHEAGDDKAARERLGEADAIFRKAQEDQSERFSNYYFVGMARFYLAASYHRAFRNIELKLPEAQMEKDLARKLELLQKAQEAYNECVEARHIYWVSAAGFQLGSLFEEFYDALMHAPVPDWLDENQRTIYYEELKKQARPVVTKAIWVFEQNLEVARKLGYENAFTEQTQERLTSLQAILLAGDATWGRPDPRLVPREGPSPAQQDVSASDRKLFVPEPTYL